MKKIILMVALMLSQLTASEFSAKDVTELENRLILNFKAMNAENLDLYMQDVHPDSPAYAGTRAFVQKLFANYDLKATHLGMKPLLIDEKYFILKAKQKTVKIRGDAPFQDNIVEAIHVYKKYKGKWLLWSSMILEVSPVK